MHPAPVDMPKQSDKPAANKGCAQLAQSGSDHCYVG